MPFMRQYEEYELRSMLQQSEIGTSPTTGQAAHSRSLHATSGGTGGISARAQAYVGAGASTQANSMQNLRNRVHQGRVNAQSSAFSSLIHQASAATQALNSATGQAGLAALDANPAPRRVVLKVAGRPLESSYAAGAVGISTTHVRRANGQDITSAVQTISAATTGVIMIIESRTTGTLHIQTCYPSDDVAMVSSFQLR